MDTLLLEDIMEAFRKSCIENFQLDPVFFYTIAGYSFNVCINNLKCRNNVITDINLYNVIKNNLFNNKSSEINWK